MKKVISLGLALTLLLALLAGCGGNNDSSNSSGSGDPAPAVGSNDISSGSDSSGSSSGKTELTIAIWGDEARAASFQETLAPFCEANNCTVKIELVPVSDFVDKLASQLGAGTAPDVFWLTDAATATFINGGWCANLKDVLTSDPDYDFDDFYPDAIGSTDYGDGGIYGVPFSFGTRAIFYNKTLFEDNGVKTPAECVADGTWTYETMFDLASQISRADSTKIGLKLWCVGQETNGLQLFADILPAYGANLVNEDSSAFTLDSEAGLQVVQMVYDAMYTNGGHAKPGDTTAFVSGNVAMARENYSYMRTVVEGGVDFEWDLVPPPYGPVGADGKAFTGYAYWCANDTSPNRELAKDLVKFITNAENLLEWSSTFMSPRSSVMDSDRIINLGDGYPSPEHVKAAFVDLIAERGLFTYRATSEWTLLLNAVQQNYEMIWAGAYSIEEGVAAMKEAIEPYLSR